MNVKELIDDCIISMSDDLLSTSSSGDNSSESAEELSERQSLSSVGASKPIEILSSQKKIFLNPTENNIDEVKLRTDHTEASIFISSTILFPLITNFKALLRNDVIKDYYEEVNQTTDSFANDGIVEFLVYVADVDSIEIYNQFTRLALLIMQFDLLEISTFDTSSDEPLIENFIKEFCSIFESNDKKFLFETYMNLKRIVVETFYENFKFEKYIFEEYSSISSLDCQLRTYAHFKYDPHKDIAKKLAKLSINDNVIKDLTTIGYVGKIFKDGKYIYDWKFEDHCDGELFGQRCDRFTESMFDLIVENFNFGTDSTLNVDYKINGSLLNVPSEFKPISQEERLSLNSLSFFANQYLKDVETDELSKDQVIFGHRGVMTKLIMMINNKKAPLTTFRVFKYKEMLFFQPIEKPYKNKSNCLNGAALAGFGFEYLMTKDANESRKETGIHYLFNKFELNGMKFIIQAEIDVANVHEEKDKIIPVELKTISVQNYNNIFSRNELYLKSWSQNYLLDKDCLTLIGVRTKSNTLKECKLHSQLNLLHSWKQTITSDYSHILSDDEIYDTTNEGLSDIFLKVRSKMNYRSISDQQILMYEFSVNTDKDTGGVKCSDYYSCIYNLNDFKKYSEVPDIFIKQSIRDIHKNMNE